MNLKKNIPLIDQHDNNGFWGGKFGGSFIPETLKKPIEDLTIKLSRCMPFPKLLPLIPTKVIVEELVQSSNSPLEEDKDTQDDR